MVQSQWILIALVLLVWVSAILITVIRDEVFSRRLSYIMMVFIFLTSIFMLLKIPIDKEFIHPNYIWLALDQWSRPLLPASSFLALLISIVMGHRLIRLDRVALHWNLAALYTVALVVKPWFWAFAFSLSWLSLLISKSNSDRKMLLFYQGIGSILILIGFAGIRPGGVFSESTAVILVMIALMIREGIFPFHSWVPQSMVSGSPLNVTYTLLTQLGTIGLGRWILDYHADIAHQYWTIGSTFALGTALYAALLGCVQTEGRRYLAFLVLSQTALTWVGLVDAQTHEFSAGQLIWLASLFSVGGLALILSAVEARVGHLRIDQYSGLYQQTPLLAWLFLFFGMSLIGLFGSLGFIAEDLMVHGGLQVRTFVGIGIAGVSALNGYSIFRVYSKLFLGKPQDQYARITDALPRERIALIAMAIMLLATGLAPGWIVRSLLESY